MVNINIFGLLVAMHWIVCIQKTMRRFKMARFGPEGSGTKGDQEKFQSRKNKKVGQVPKLGHPNVYGAHTAWNSC